MSHQEKDHIWVDIDKHAMQYSGTSTRGKTMQGSCRHSQETGGAAPLIGKD